ncbi:MAG: response regulator [Anaerolineae bacterium]|nr:response regulator [Anaerolineae bacterium]
MAEQPKTPLILVVDDDWMNREVIEAHLHTAGYDVAVAHSGEQALESAGQTPPDLILLDVRLQGLSGYAVCQQLKVRAATHSTPVMMISALEGDPEQRRAIEAGADDFITKPFSALVLLTRVRNLLRLKALEDAAQVRDRRLRQVLCRYVDDELADQILADLSVF